MNRAIKEEKQLFEAEGGRLQALLERQEVSPHKSFFDFGTDTFMAASFARAEEVQQRKCFVAGRCR